ncbi:MAG: MarR family transcriptional regulator [Spirochaetales bacterium]|nr:MarR family transcriptional regulator [Spirochaetales bacterium]
MPLKDKEYLQINQALFTLTHAYESRMAKEKNRNEMGLKMSDCSVLMVMGRFAPINARRLSHLMDVKPANVSVYVQRLVERGLVKKKQDPEDRRNWHLALTVMGQLAAKGVIAGAVEYTRDFMAALDKDEQQSLHRLLLKVSHSLGFEWQ